MSTNNFIDAAALPSYLSSNPDQITPEMRKIATPFAFPLSDEDRVDINILEQKFDHEGACAGLAAPQIGIFKRVIIFAALDTPEQKKWRKDLVQAMPRTVWLNPTYQSAGEETYEDYEACFSILNTAALVTRYKKIEYAAYGLDGNFITGTAAGFLARLIQHEIDHLDGKFFVDNVSPEKIMTMDEYKALRAQAFASAALEAE